MKNTFLKILIVLLSIFIGNNLGAQSLKLDWAAGIKDSIGLNSNNTVIGYSIVRDNSGNVYTTGGFQGTVDFDPGLTVFNLFSVGVFSIFIQKLDSNGNFVWAKSFVGTGSSVGYSSAIDKNTSEIITTGYFNGVLDFDPGIGTFNLSSNGVRDVYVQKLDANGSFIWAKSFGGINSDVGNSIAVDNLGNTYLTGSYSSIVDFDPDPSVFNLTSAGGDDFFVEKLDANGNFVWAKSIGGVSTENSTSIAVDNVGNTCITGFFTGVADFDPGPSVFNLTSAGGNDIFIEKLDINGDFIWAKSLEGTFSNRSTSITTDVNDNIYFTGYFDGIVDFDPGIGVLNSASTNPSSDVFIEKLDSAGNYIWVKLLRGTLLYSNSITVDSSSNVYTTGAFWGNVDFDPGGGVSNITSNNSRDVFISKLDSNGNYQLAKNFGKIGGTLWNTGYGIIADNYENIYVTGNFTETVDFDPGPNIFNLEASSFNFIGTKATFVLKLNPCIESYSTLTINNCGPYIAPSGVMYSTTGIYSDFILNSSGCDSIITINYTNNNSTSFFTINRCTSYTVPSGDTTYTTLGSYFIYDTISSYLGCDSIMTISLSLNDEYSSDLVFACDSFMMPSMTQWYYTSGVYYDTIPNLLGCFHHFIDTFIVYNTSFSSITMNSCNVIFSLSGNQIWTTSGVYMDTISNGSPASCDSIITTTVTIDTLYPVVTLPSFNPDTLCLNSNITPLPVGLPVGGNYFGNGVTGGNFDPTIAGLGTHNITYTYSDGTCANSDTSFVTVILCIGIDEMMNEFGILTYPNPTNGVINIDLTNYYSEVNYDLKDIMGRSIITGSIYNKAFFSINLEEFSKGIYFIHLNVGDKSAVLKIVKE